MIKPWDVSDFNVCVITVGRRFGNRFEKSHGSRLFFYAIGVVAIGLVQGELRISRYFGIIPFFYPYDTNSSIKFHPMGGLERTYKQYTLKIHVLMWIVCYM